MSTAPTRPTHAEREAIAAYLREPGATIRKARVKFGRSAKLIRKVAAQASINLRTPSALDASPEEIQALLDDYRSLASIARQYEVSEGSVRRFVDRHGLVVRGMPKPTTGTRWPRLDPDAVAAAERGVWADFRPYEIRLRPVPRMCSVGGLA